MRILFATPVPPLLTKPRPHFFIKHLAEAGHRVSLALQVQSEAESARLETAPGWAELQPYLSSVEHTVVTKAESILRCAVSLPSRTPLRVAYCRSSVFRSQVRRALDRESVELLHVDRERLAPLFSDAGVPAVLDATDCLSYYLRAVRRYGPAVDRAVSAFELLKMPDFERTMAAGYASCIVTSARDATELRGIGFAAPLVVIPNGLDERYLSCGRNPEDDLVTFVGNMTYPPNVDGMLWFKSTVWPRLKRLLPPARLAIVGYNPVRAITKLDSMADITVTGTVDDVLPWLQKTQVFVSPLRIGGGFPNKLAEALALGVPVVATSAASEGIPEALHGRHLLIADSAGDFADSVADLMENPSLQDTLSSNARELMASHYRWPDVAQRLAEVHARAAAMGSAT